ncbi:alpha/beta hydrolase [Nocardioides conyzicola]|uniref:Alpha/beta hydrolase n=1 Tax=Nocardioides conyzicola TaxID=1651781 RepID=A0ABP8WVZ1_9ACTN
MRLTILGVLTALSATLLVPAVGSPATAARPQVVSRSVVFDVENTNATAAVCLPDNRSYRLRGRLVGPRRAIEGRSGAIRVNVLVHDAGTGGWFWRLPGHPGYDYARRLAQHGETSLVLDRLGYGANASDASSCLGAQADMLHQVVQHLRSGRYDFVDRHLGGTPPAARVVTHGHGVGAAIAQVEAATFDDVAGLVLMSWTDRPGTGVARDALGDQTAACLTGVASAPAASAAAFRHQLFAAAPARVQRRAAALRAAVPCGEVTSRAPMVLASGLGAGQVDAPVLLLYGSKDALTRPAARSTQASAYPTKVTTRTFAGAGNALPLERPAQVGATVRRWLR